MTGVVKGGRKSEDSNDLAAAEAIAKLYKASASDMSDYTRMMQGMIETLKESERRKEPEGLGFMGIGI